MPRELKPRSHPVKKGETIQSIAKKYGFKDWKEVWKHPGNEKLRKIKKDGKDLAPGDTVTVPALNEEEREERSAKISDFSTKISDGRFLAAQLLEMALAYYEQAKMLDREAMKIGATYDSLAKEINTLAADVRKKSLTADIVAKLVATVGYGASTWKENGKSLDDIKTWGQSKLDKLTTPLGKLGVGASSGLIGFEVAKKALEALGVQEKDHVDEVEILTVECGRLWVNISRPSFYGNAVVKLIDGGSWSEAVTADVQSDLKLAIDKIEKDKQAAVAMINATAERTRGRAVQARADSAKVLKGVDKLKAEYDAL